jgi:hypothetical protein
MMTYPKISMLGNLSRSLIFSKKDIVSNYFSLNKKIERTSNINLDDQMIQRYHQFINWDREELAPTLPYALLTHMQFSMVTDKRFPFSPFGLIHKNERIECLAPLKKGKWEMHCSIPLFRRVEKGYEIEVVSILKIDGEIAWRSTTTAFKQLKKGISRYRFDPIDPQGKEVWTLTPNHGFQYAKLSNNFDLIHISKITAKMMGLKNPIMHGMWTAARGLSSYRYLKYPFQIDFRFVAPIYLPSNVIFQEKENSFNVYSEDGHRLHLEANFI